MEGGRERERKGRMREKERKVDMLWMGTISAWKERLESDKETNRQ